MKRFIRLFRKKKMKESIAADAGSDRDPVSEMLHQKTEIVPQKSKTIQQTDKKSEIRYKTKIEKITDPDLPRDAENDSAELPATSDDDEIPKYAGVRSDCWDVIKRDPVEKSQTALISSESRNITVLDDVKKMLDPNTLARIAAPQPLNNFMHRLPTVERLESEGIYTLYEPTVKLISEVTEEVGDQLSQLLSPRKVTSSNVVSVPRITNGNEDASLRGQKLLHWRPDSENIETEAYV
jgi:hypothetical protein